MNVIAMSVPATGRMALYRNPLPEVVRFLESRHAERYMVFNCCPEHPYPTDKFTTGVFECIDMLLEPSGGSFPPSRPV